MAVSLLVSRQSSSVNLIGPTGPTLYIIVLVLILLVLYIGRFFVNIIFKYTQPELVR